MQAATGLGFLLDTSAHRRQAEAESLIAAHQASQNAIRNLISCSFAAVSKAFCCVSGRRWISVLESLGLGRDELDVFLSLSFLFVSRIRQPNSVSPEIDAMRESFTEYNCI